MELILLLVGLLLLSIFKPQIKGYLGEIGVSGILNSLPETHYKVLNDIMLVTEYGTTQIDHVVVSVYGIFVIETKNYKGWITGSEHGEMWTKNMYGKKYSFRNPLRQNYAHVKALSTKLGIPEEKFIPIVVFSVNSDIKVKTNKPVVYTVQLRQVIQQYQSIRLEEHQIGLLVNQIIGMNINSKETRAQHVDSIRARVANNDANIARNTCPRCGGTLVERKGKYGAFWGCKNYPKCRYTKNRG